MQIDNEIKRLQALKKRNNSLVDNLKNRLVGAIQMFGEFTVGTNTFGLRKSERGRSGGREPTYQRNTRRSK